jgi:hypothetical protein
MWRRAASDPRQRLIEVFAFVVDADDGQVVVTDDRLEEQHVAAGSGHVAQRLQGILEMVKQAVGEDDVYLAGA